MSKLLNLFPKVLRWLAILILWLAAGYLAILILHLLYAWTLFVQFASMMKEAGIPAQLSNFFAVWITAFAVWATSAMLTAVLLRKRHRYFLVATCVSLVFALSYVLELRLGTASFNPITGQARYRYNQSENGAIELFPLDYRYNPQTGEQLKNLTPLVAKQYGQQKGTTPKDPSFVMGGDLYNRETGLPRFRYSLTGDGSIELFSNDNQHLYHPQTGEALKLLTREVALKYRQQIQRPPVVSNAKPEDLFDRATGQPRFRFWMSSNHEELLASNGSIELYPFDNQFHPKTGEALTPLTREALKEIQDYRKTLEKYKQLLAELQAEKEEEARKASAPPERPASDDGQAKEHEAEEAEASGSSGDVPKKVVLKVHLQDGLPEYGVRFWVKSLTNTEKYSELVLGVEKLPGRVFGWLLSARYPLDTAYLTDGPYRYELVDDKGGYTEIIGGPQSDDHRRRIYDGDYLFVLRFQPVRKLSIPLWLHHRQFGTIKLEAMS
ncbi:MAG: hypothetical protein ACM3KM_02675 [Acidobacteriaceae bacterium]